MRAALIAIALVAALFALACTRATSLPAQDWRDPSPHQVLSITVDKSVRLEVLDWGGSGPPLALLGCYLTAHVYDDFAPKLTDRFHVYGITRRGIGASDKPPSGYTAQRSADDVLEVLDSLEARKSVLIGTSCAGQVLSTLGSQHSERLHALVYLEAADDPTVGPADYDPPFPDPVSLPPKATLSAGEDYRSFDAYRAAQRRNNGVVFPESELRQQFVANADGSMGPSRLSPAIRRAITVDSRVRPEYARIRVPVLAIYRTDPPFEEWASAYAPRNEQERSALRQEYAATRAMYARWQRDLLEGVPTARIVEIPGASVFMFLSNETDVLRELRAFADTLTSR